MREVGVAYVEADADAVEVADVEDFEDVLGRGDFVLQVFDEEADAEGVGEGLEVLDGGEGVFEGAGVPGVALLAEVEDAGADGNLLGGLEGALDLVHGGDAVGFFGVDEIDVRGDVAGPLAASAVAEVEGLVERGGDAGVAEPGGDVADGGAVVVVEVMAGGEDLDGLDTIGRAGFVEGVEQAGVKALLEEDVGGEGGLHHFLRYSRAGRVWLRMWRGGSGSVGSGVRLESEGQICGRLNGMSWSMRRLCWFVLPGCCWGRLGAGGGGSGDSGERWA